MIIVGGTYGERALFPDWDQIYGSGARAAFLLGHLIGKGVEFYTYLADEYAEDIQALAKAHKIVVHGPVSRQPIKFSYLHCLADPVIKPAREEIHQLAPLSVKGDKVLSFGFMEGTALVKARMAVYDPQSPSFPKYFKANGSSAEKLTVVLNRDEAFKYCRQSRTARACYSRH